MCFSCSNSWAFGNFDQIKEKASSEMGDFVNEEILPKLLHNDPVLMEACEDFLDVLNDKYDPSSPEAKLVFDSLIYAAEKHFSGLRKGTEKTPYIIHPIRVASSLLWEAKVYDPQVLAAALLHDVVEDTGTKFGEITQKFGPQISSLVKELSDEMNEETGEKIFTKLVRKEKEIDHASSLTSQARLIKLADKLDNLRDLARRSPENWSSERVDEYFRFVGRIVENIKGTNKTLEDKIEVLLEERLGSI